MLRWAGLSRTQGKAVYSYSSDDLDKLLHPDTTTPSIANVSCQRPLWQLLSLSKAVNGLSDEDAVIWHPTERCSSWQLCCEKCAMNPLLSPVFYSGLFEIQSFGCDHPRIGNYRITIWFQLFCQSNQNKDVLRHGSAPTFVSSDRSSYSDVVLIYISIHSATFSKNKTKNLESWAYLVNCPTM